MNEARQQAPPAGEDVHLPGPTVLPLVTAVGLTLIVIGTTLTWIASVVGLVIVVLTAIRWIRGTRRDISELPERHR
jgi:Flp pilus assembly protein TadB